MKLAAAAGCGGGHHGRVLPSPEEEHLLAIVRAPEDDAPRLAFAEYLRPYEPALAMFIQLQVERVARMRRAGQARTEQLPAEEHQLLQRHAAAWSRGVSRFVQKPGVPGPGLMFYRGLVAYLCMDADVLVEYGDYLVRTTAVRHVDFAPLRAGTLERLLAFEGLSALDSVGFPGAGLDDGAVAAIARCPHLANCRYLDLRGNALTPRAFAALGASPYLTKLPPHGSTVSRFDARWYAERLVRLPDAITAALRGLTRHSDLLPDVLEAGRVHRVDDPTDTRDQEDLRVVAGIGPDGRPYLDYFRVGDPTSDHARLHADGSREPLENYTAQFGFPVLPDAEQTRREHERIAAHNAEVLAVLRRKGFED